MRLFICGVSASGCTVTHKLLTGTSKTKILVIYEKAQPLGDRQNNMSLRRRGVVRAGHSCEGASIHGDNAVLCGSRVA